MDILWQGLQCVSIYMYSDKAAWQGLPRFVGLPKCRSLLAHLGVG